MTTTQENPQVQAIRQSVMSSYNALQQLIQGQLTLLPAQKLYQTSSEDEWTLMQSLAHIIEFMPYWSDEIVKLVAQPGQNFGRTHKDEARIQAIEHHKQDTLEEAQAALARSYQYLDTALSTLKDSDLELTGRHLKFGEQTLAWFIKDFVTDHLTNHLAQLNSSLEEIADK